MNMSYCRNTYKSLCDCDENMKDEDLSDSEKKYRQRLMGEKEKSLHLWCGGCVSIRLSEMTGEN